MTSRLKKHAATNVLVAAATLGAGLAHAVGVPGQGTWEVTLQPRELDGNVTNGPEAFYDTALNITWLRNANVGGLMDWSTAVTWANTLVVGGVGGWRLPTMVDTGLPGCGFSLSGDPDCGYNVPTASSEMAHLYYVTLGNLAYCPPGDATCAGGPQTGWGLSNTGGFQDVQSYNYWFGTAYAPDPFGAWFFDQFGGGQSYGTQANVFYAMAVRAGDVAAIPEPQTYALTLMGVGALMLAVRRRTR